MKITYQDKQSQLVPTLLSQLKPGQLFTYAGCVDDDTQVFMKCDTETTLTQKHIGAKHEMVPVLKYVSLSTGTVIKEEPYTDINIALLHGELTVNVVFSYTSRIGVAVCAHCNDSLKREA